MKCSVVSKMLDKYIALVYTISRINKQNGVVSTPSFGLIPENFDETVRGELKEDEA